MLHIPGSAQNLIFVRKMGDAGVQTMFEKDKCKMVQGELVLMRGSGHYMSYWGGSMPVDVILQSFLRPTRFHHA